MSSFLLSAFQLALCLAPMAMGIFITMKVFNIPDITTDGSYTLGATVTAVLLSQHMPIWMILPISMGAGAIAGTCTGWIHTKLKIDALLSGILIMTALYSVNLMIMGRSNIPLVDIKTIFNFLSLSGEETIDALIIAFLIVCVLVFIIIYLLKTDFGISMRATGNNPVMTRALGINNDRIKIIGLSISNALTAMSGFLVAQYQGFADINMGIGIVITGLGSVLIADTLKNALGIKKIGIQILLLIVGCVVFQMVLAFALSIGIDPGLLKLITAAFVLAIVSIPEISKRVLKK
jgi:putative ABC transport system permease protein